MHSIEGKDYIAALPFQVSAVLLIGCFFVFRWACYLFAHCAGVAAGVLRAVGERNEADEGVARW